MVILEKAYAKFNVNYSNLEMGFPMQSMRDLTGMPVIWYPIHSQSDDEFFKIIHEADRKKWSMAASCFRSVFGLEQAHGYTLIDAIILEDEYG